MCLRNHEECPTIVSTYDPRALDHNDMAVLFEDRYLVPPNVAQAKNGERFLRRTQVLFGNRQRPYLRVNMCQMSPADYDGAPGQALARLFASIVANRCDVHMRPGDCLYVDNFSTAHARPAYQPRVDGTGRWLKRIVLYRDVRRPVEFLSEDSARVLE
jgi:L-asparagine oxygenase